MCTLDKVFHSADNGHSTLLVLLDYSAAFDTIDHSILFDRLKYSFGFTGTAFTWLQSYLTGRSHLLSWATITHLPLPLPLVSRRVLF